MRKIALIMVMVLSPLILTGQKTLPGIAVGINMANWLGDNILFAEDLSYNMNLITGSSDFVISSGSRIGFSAGLLVDIPVTRLISVQPELSYSQKGAKFSGTGTVEYQGNYYSVDEDWILQLDYVDLIILAKISITKGNTKPYLIAGPGLGYLASSKLKVTAKVEGDSNSDSSDADFFRNLDYHVNVGAGLDFNDVVRLEFRYYHFFKPATDDSKTEYKLYNSVKSLSLIFFF